MLHGLQEPRVELLAPPPPSCFPCKEIVHAPNQGLCIAEEVCFGVLVPWLEAFETIEVAEMSKQGELGRK